MVDFFEFLRFAENVNDFSTLIIAISITRFQAMEAKKLLEKKGYKIGIIHILWIKPLKISKVAYRAIEISKFGALLLDDDYTDGISNSLANKINLKTNRRIETMGLKNKTAGAHKQFDNLPPSVEEIVSKIKRILSEKR